MLNINNKTAIITGGGSGIGKAIAELFSKNGAEVYILELNTEAAHTVVQGIKEQGGNAHYISCDVADQAAVFEVFNTIVNQTGSLDILINNAGIAHIGDVLNTTEEDFERIYNVNIKGIYNCLKAGVEKMVQSEKGGVILNMASVAATLGIKDRFAYSMSKGAVLSMTLSVAKDYLDKNIRCNCISPGRVHTPFVDGFLAKNYPGRETEMFEKLSKTQPIGRMGKPIEIAALALFLCSEEAAFITGCNYPIDGGFITLNTG
ncbi:MAG: SDR family oxidoreductase [Bacteroidota bacterium]|jgi:NAD(P)-dependent dehydrogenase (short-subunit alcohol dehydrogenase family)|nr:SDR family oxidoreductase [Bacteroidota bacterium]